MMDVIFKCLKRMRPIVFSSPVFEIPLYGFVLFFMLAVYFPPNASAADLNRQTFGIRSGVGDSRNKESFSQQEAYAVFSLPWKRRLHSGWMFGPTLGVNAGVLFCRRNAFVAAIGPGAYMMSPSGRLLLSIGVYPTYISRSTFGTEDFGGNFQFTSFLSLNFGITKNTTIGYRFQHMSNAGLFEENPGLNTHWVEIGYNF